MNSKIQWAVAAALVTLTMTANAQESASLKKQEVKEAPLVGAPLPATKVAPENLPPLPGGEQTKADFNEIMTQVLGLTPEQIKVLKAEQSKRQKAASEPAGKEPKQVTGSIQVSLTPGSTPPVLRLFSGYSTAITVVDSTGALWPIENFNHKSNGIEINRLDGEKGSMFTITPKTNYGSSNLILYPQGSKSMITVSLIIGQNEVDVKSDLRIQAVGPNAQIAMAGLPASTNPNLYTLLEGVAPPDAKELKLIGGEGRAWLTKTGRMFIRTPLKLISPTWIGSARSADGMNVYEMMPANAIRVLQDGSILSIGIEGW